MNIIIRPMKIGDYEEVRKIERKGEEVRALLAEQYDSVLKILGAPTAREIVP